MEYDDKKFLIEKGKNFYIPIFGIHHDDRYYKNPEKFDPERFNEENRRNIDPDTYLPFGNTILFLEMKDFSWWFFVFFI